MAKIPRTKVYNPQKAEAYVGKGVLRNGDTLTAIKGHFSPVPNGPLIKKKGPFKGSTLKNGSTVKAGGQTHKVFKKKVDKGLVVLHQLGNVKKVRILQEDSTLKVEPLTTELTQVSLVLKLHNLKEVLEKDHSVQGCLV